MSRNLIICCDGTWNSPDQKDRGQEIPSNVVKMARALETNFSPENPQQLIYYDTGIGTGKFKYISGMSGFGLCANILQAYQTLCYHYREGDKIFLFGFSRGAFTVRSLAGMIQCCGLLPAPAGKSAPPFSHREESVYLEGIVEAYEAYRKSCNDKKISEAFRQHHKTREVAIHFIGVWDTVGALGVPALSTQGIIQKVFKTFSQNTNWDTEFHNVTLGSRVTHAYHALAIDERRGSFRPSLWEGITPLPGQKVEQCWFAGVHSNIGGGYVDSGLSDHSFLWMVEKAKQAGLLFDACYLALRTNPNAYGELRNSMNLVYKGLPAYDRPIGQPETIGEFIHLSAIKRIQHPTTSYLPKMLEKALSPEIIASIRNGNSGVEHLNRMLQAAGKKIRITSTGMDLSAKLRAMLVQSP
jgi:uncharacterized protein (DUF2235 family)